VMPGDNEFEYSIRERDQVIDSGRFTATVERLLRQERRNASWVEEQVCANSSVSANVCADLRQRKQLRCPGGQVLQTQMANDESAIRTLISNQTNQKMRITVDGEKYRLDAGEQVVLRRQSDFTVEFQPKACVGPVCSPSRTITVKPGQRLKFQTNYANSKQVELVDYPR
jgi:hypothetical protein